MTSVRGPSNEIQVATVTLSDAQIKLLLAGFDIVPAPGPGKFLMFIAASISLDATAGAYTGEDASDPSNPFTSSLYFALDPTNIVTDASDPVPLAMFAGAAKVVAWVPQLSDTDVFLNDANVVENLPLGIVFQNSVNLSGGNPANTLKVTVYYVVVTLQ